MQKLSTRSGRKGLYHGFSPSSKRTISQDHSPYVAPVPKPPKLHPRETPAVTFDHVLEHKDDYTIIIPGSQQTPGQTDPFLGDTDSSYNPFDRFLRL